MKIGKYLILLGIVILLSGCTKTNSVDDILPSSSAPIYVPPDIPESSNLNVNNLDLSQDNNLKGEENMPAKKLNPPEMQIDQNKTYTAILTTSEGEIKINLYANKTPKTVNNFVYLGSNNFYDGTIFHRVIKDFMIQGGDPNGNGTGGPGYKFDDEPFEGEYKRGTLAMANAGPNTNGSQFFIMHKDYNLPKNYVIFGKVTEGMDVVDTIATAETKPNVMGENSTPVSPVTVEKVEIIEE